MIESYSTENRRVDLSQDRVNKSKSELVDKGISVLWLGYLNFRLDVIEEMKKQRNSVGYTAIFAVKNKKMNEGKEEKKIEMNNKQNKSTPKRRGLHLYQKLTNKTNKSKEVENKTGKNMTQPKPVTPKNRSSAKSYQIIPKTSERKTPKFKKSEKKTPKNENSKTQPSQTTSKNSIKISEKSKNTTKVSQSQIPPQIDDDPTPKTLTPPLKTLNQPKKPSESPSSTTGTLIIPSKSLEFSEHLNSEKLSEIEEPLESSKNQKFIDLFDNQINVQDSFAQPEEKANAQSFGNFAGEVMQQQLEEIRRENEFLQMQNARFQNQTQRYEEMLSKMNQEYEKLLVHSTSTDKDILTLKNELSDNSLISEKTINHLKEQLKVEFHLFLKLNLHRKHKEKLRLKMRWLRNQSRLFLS